MNLRIEGPLFFGSVEHVDEQFRRVEDRFGVKRSQVVNLKGVGKIDLTGADFLLNECRTARSRGQDFHIISSHKSSLEALRRLHVTDVVGEDHIHSSKADAIKAAVRDANNDVCCSCKARIFHECSGKPGPNNQEQ